VIHKVIRQNIFAGVVTLTELTGSAVAIAKTL